MSKADIAHDFGLRSIKAIVGIAENLKLQAQNILDSDLTEIIDDYSMDQIPYKGSQIINDVMTATQARITRLTDTKITKGKGAFQGGEELVKIDETNENDRESNISPTMKQKGLGGTNQDIDKRQELELIGEDIKGK